MVLHVAKESDVRFQSTARKYLINILKVQYLALQKRQTTNLPIYGVDKANMSMFEKTDRDVKKGVVSKEPDEMQRLEDEDLLKVNLDETIVGLSDEDATEDHYEKSSSESLQADQEESKTNVDYIDI